MRITGLALIGLLLMVTAVFSPVAQATGPVFKTLTGEQFHLSALEGQAVLLTFWSPSCGPCMEEVPALKALSEEIPALGATLISVAMPYDPPNQVLETTEVLALPYPVALDLQGEITAEYGVKGTPTSLLINPQGKIDARHIGKLDKEALLAKIRSYGLAPVDKPSTTGG